MKVLLLAGTAEARQLAQLLSDQGHDVLASLSGATRDPKPFPVATRTGGFGGEKAQEAFMQQAAFDAVIDATHPFAEQISTRSFQISSRLGTSYLRLLRSEWSSEPGDNWQVIAIPEDAARHIPSGTRVLLATGALSLDEWVDLAKDRTLFCRRVDPTDAPFPYEGSWIVGRPPFSVEDEVKMLRENRITHVVCKNAGGAAQAKLIAARQLGLPVVMLARPPVPDCQIADTVEGAVAWLNSLKS
ncbi:cobalt-precorrin-6A reductase [Aliiroseovarius sp. F20344]|uniref:cobalt-precorrin-6A reductase n=1 Tax=Aliiroseovarius sp. F20344 TaxID=2926414 RepID=UPI001FF617A6|nr:cobalt-precorrin-6A reductase [Aliiroseovarius sp. F20344]MCK0143825.1 cobalt-precorrin-6A reductase [Aliiroseovarius sp. F20344]